MHRRTLIAFLALLTVTMLHAQQADPVIDWIRNHAVPLKTPEAGNGFDDMRPLKKLIGKARIVSLGEATHGSREFFQLKHRMLEFLASEMGFSIFSIEANHAGGVPAERLRAQGKGRSAQTDARNVLLDVEHRGSAGDDPLDARVQQVGQGARAVYRLRHADADVANEIVRDFVARYDGTYDATWIRRGRSPRQRRGRMSAHAFGVATGTFPVRAGCGQEESATAVTSGPRGSHAASPGSGGV